MKAYTVCLCFGREKCEQITKALAEKNGADSYIIEPVLAPCCTNPGYRGQIIFNETG